MEPTSGLEPLTCRLRIREGRTTPPWPHFFSV